MYWTTRLVVQVPQQNNGIDCGVYMLKNGERVLQNLQVVNTIQPVDLQSGLSRLIGPESFTASDVQQQRTKFQRLVDDLVERYKELDEGLLG